MSSKEFPSPVAAEMRNKLIVLLLLATSFLTGCVSSRVTDNGDFSLNPAGEIPVRINWRHENLVEGYNHPNRITVFIDGKPTGTSGIVEQSAEGKYELLVSPGKHRFRVEVSVYYKSWESESKANEYSVDAFFEDEMDFTSPVSIEMVMDIAAGTTEVSVK